MDKRYILPIMLVIVGLSALVSGLIGFIFNEIHLLYLSIVIVVNGVIVSVIAKKMSE